MAAATATLSSVLLDLLFDDGAAGRCLVAPDGTILRANATWLSSTGHSLDAVLGVDILDLVPGTRDVALALHARARAGHHVQVPRHAQRVEGRETWWEESIDPVPMEGGIGLLITARQVPAGAAVAWASPGPSSREGAERFRLLADAMAQIVCVLEPDGTATYINSGWTAFSGLDLEATVRAGWGRVLHPDDLEAARACRRRALDTLAPQDVELRYRAAGGAYRWFLNRLAPVVEGGRVVRFVGTATDIEDRRRAEQDLRRREEDAQRRAAELQAVLDAVPAAVFITRDPTAQTMEANRFCAETLRMPQGFNVSKSAPEGQRPAGFRAMKDGVEIPPERLPVQLAAFTGRELRDYELDLVFPDGTTRHLFGNATALRAPDGQLAGAVGAFLDITDRKQAAEALRDANERLRDADRRKDEFLAILSHELRNPLAPIRNAAYILERADPGGEQARRARGVLRRQSEHLTRLVDDLLDVTRITRGKIALQRSRIDLREAVLRAADDVRTAMAERGIAFRTAVPQAEVWAHADPTRVNQVVSNLLHNAAKFSGRGDEVVLSLSPQGSTAEIRVRDTGAGIDASVLPRIFDAFVQADRTLARSEGGLGLGLALVKGIVELHGGEVRAESAGIGKGTEFIVRLPMLEPVPAAERGGAVHAPRRGRRVLVVDDNEDAAESLADVLRMLGHEADVAYDGFSALAKLGSSTPDAVLCDIGLPGMNGYELAKAVRAKGHRGVRLVALSGYAQVEDVKRALEAGFDAHVAKPPDPEQLARLLGD